MNRNQAFILLLVIALFTLEGCTAPIIQTDNTEERQVTPEIASDKSEELPPMPPGFYQSQCRSDSDCIAFPEGCCTCRAGGKQKAIPLSQSEALKDEIMSVCKGVLCAQVISNHPSCFKKPRCQGGMCVLQGPE